MSAPNRDNRRFQSGSVFGKTGGTYVCRCCKRNTRETGEGESDIQLCAYCFLESGIENALSDGAMEQPEFEASIDALQKQYKRGKYAKTEADVKTRKIQSSRYVAPAGPSKAEINVAVGKLVKELKSKDAAIKAVLDTEGPEELKALMGFGTPKKSRKPKQAATQSKFQAAGDALHKALPVTVTVGRGIEQVMQLDDAGVLKEFGLEIVKQTKSTITLKASRKDLGNFQSACRDRISSQYTSPLWYMSSADATVKKIEAALGKEGK